MNCCHYKFAFAPLFACLVFCATGAEAFGQVKGATPLQIEDEAPEIATPAEELGDSTGNKSTLAPLLGSPQANPGQPAALPHEAPQTELPQPPPIGTAGPRTQGEDYWKPTAGKTESLKYEKLDAETDLDRFNADSVRKLRKPMQDIRIVAEDNAEVPENLAAQFMLKEPVLKIVAAGISPPRPDRYPIQFKHRPLYYEQPHLERCGRGCGLAQNAISAGQFYMNTFFLPYHMCKTKPGCPVSSGGDCLSCEPYSSDCSVFPLSYKGLATEAASFAGFTFLLL